MNAPRILGGLSVVVLFGCAPRPPANSLAAVRAHNLRLDRARQVLERGGKLAENSLYACMLNGFDQGLPLEQVSDQCAIQLVEDDGKGFGGPLGEPGNQEMFDPAKITMACSTGDPTRSQSSGFARKPGYGWNTWGGDRNNFYQLSKEESEKQKTQAIQRLEEAYLLFHQLADKAAQARKELEEAKKTGNQGAIDAAQKKYDEAQKLANDQAEKAKELYQDAMADPNRRPQPNTRPGDDSPCQQALDAAREVLRECHRTNWQDFRCQRLKAGMDRCPDPTLILVDPEQGYACGAKPDPEAVKNAWVKRCELRVRYGPDAPNPCQPPTIDESGRIGSGKIDDVCNDPHAYLNPESNDCAATFEIQPFGQPTVADIVVWGMNKIGGPLIILPPRTPVSPRPHGPDPGPPPP